MGILIINSPLYREPWNNYDEVLPPIWLWYLCTNLKQNWFSVELFDAVASKTPLDKIIDYIEHWNFSHVWLNIFSTNHRLVEEIVTRVSKNITFLIWWAFTKSNYQDITNWKTNNEINVVIWEADIITSAIVSWKVEEKPIIQDGNKKVYKVDKHSKYFPQDISSLNYWVDFRISVFQFRLYHWIQLYYNLVEKWYVIWDIKPTNNIWNKKIWEYDFSNWNLSWAREESIKKHIEQIRVLNKLSLKFVPYYWVLKNFPQNWVFFVWLSYKLGKDWTVLEAFCNTTNSWKIITNITSICWLDWIYKTNLVKWVPLDENRKIRYPNKIEKNDWIDILIREINLFKPRFVFLFWKQVSDFVLKKLNPIKISENEYRYWETIFVLSEHPSYIAVYKRKQIDNYTSWIIERIKGNT